uniref:Uncharacterized protein n=1 Tax=Nomascus leucogenys TaxID=61853 RepID=A0A2I3FWV0_NOMLE
ISLPVGLGGGCSGDPRSTRRRPPERNCQSARLLSISATSSSLRSGTGRQQVGAQPGALPTPCSLSHSNGQPCGAPAYKTAHGTQRAQCRRPAPSSTTKRPPTGSCATERSPAATSRRRSGSSPCVRRATRSSALFSCGSGWAGPQSKVGAALA